ncbi:MAG: type II secretion system protein N [Sphingopyxis sp.]
MMRAKWFGRCALACALVCALALLVFLPMRLALGMIGLADMGGTARGAHGLVWGGYVEKLRFSGLDVGTVDVGLAPAPLLMGRAQLAFTRAAQPGTPPLSGTLESGWGHRAVRDVQGVINGDGSGALPVDRVTFDQLSVQFRDGACVAASGRVRLALGLRVAGLVLRNGLSGQARCAGRALLLPLTGESGMERLLLTIEGDGQYSARIIIRAADPILGAALSIAGFSSTAEGFAKNMRGHF